MDKDKIHWRNQWQDWATDWTRQMDKAGLGGLASAIKEAGKPVAPLAAQVALLAQPIFAVFAEPTAALALADLLDEFGLPNDTD